MNSEKVKTGGITEKEGVPYVWNVPCFKDTDYKFSEAKLKGLSYWICPHCLKHLSLQDEIILCAQGCHLKNDPKTKSVFIKSDKNLISGKKIWSAIKQIKNINLNF